MLVVKLVLVVGTRVVAELRDTVPVAAPEGNSVGWLEVWRNEVGGGGVDVV